MESSTCGSELGDGKHLLGRVARLSAPDQESQPTQKWGAPRLETREMWHPRCLCARKTSSRSILSVGQSRATRPTEV